MLIDIHVHTCRWRHQKIVRRNGTHYPTPDTLIEMMDAHGIDKALCMTAVSPAYRYTLVPPEEMLAICGEYPDRLIPTCNLDPRWLDHAGTSNFRGLLEAYKEMGCRSVGEYIVNLPFDDPLNMNFFAHVEETGLPLTFHIAHRVGGTYGCVDELGLPRLERVLAAFPKLTFLAHSQCFWSHISADVTEENWMTYPKGPVVPGRVVELMRRYPNLVGDLSAGSGYNAISRDPEFGYAFMEEFKDRLCFGTDIANVPQKLPIVPYFAELKEKELISFTAYENITWRNADRVLGLGLA
jgi:predicted TIM-barrel fold metal-dependent hydrolase